VRRLRPSSTSTTPGSGSETAAASACDPCRWAALSRARRRGGIVRATRQFALCPEPEGALDLVARRAFLAGDLGMRPQRARAKRCRRKRWVTRCRGGSSGCGSVKLRAQARQRKRRLRQQRQVGRPWHRQSAREQLRRSTSSSSQPPASARPAPRRSATRAGARSTPRGQPARLPPRPFWTSAVQRTRARSQIGLVVAPNPRPQDEGIEAARHAPVKWPTQAPGSAKGSSQSASTPVPSSASAPLMRPRWTGQTTAW
jgi:hypothetical protein